mgnify:FL=1
MKRIQMNNTDLTVSPIAIGTVNFGSSVDSKTAKHQLDLFFELGGNFIDTAHVYGDWAPGPKGKSERIIGEWLNAAGVRKEIAISTKGGHPDLSDMDLSKITPERVKKDLEESIEYLKTDYIDLYFLHRDNPDVPVGEFLGVLEEAKDEGMIRYYGCSNWKLERIIAAENYAKKHNYTGFICNQLMWSLADINSRGVEDKTLVFMDEKTYEYHKKTGLNAMAYTAAAKGYFTKLYSGVTIPEKTAAKYNTPSNSVIFDELVKTAEKLNVSLIEVELAFLMHQDFVCIPIVTFSNDEQLKQGIKSCDLELEHEIVEKFRSMKKYVL